MNLFFSKMMLGLLSVFFFIILGCVAEQYRSAENMVELGISFADSSWDGKTIPEGQRCNKFGGKASGTPVLAIKNIPVRTNALIFEYSDADSDLMNNGGHGKISYAIKPGTTRITVPSVPGHTFDLPENFTLVSAHNGPQWDKSGAYMPPCSGGKNHLYYVTVKAVFDSSVKDGSMLLAKGRLDLGRY